MNVSPKSYLPLDCSRTAGFKSGCLTPCFMIEKTGLLFPGYVPKISKYKCIGHANRSCKKQTDSQNCLVSHKNK